MPLKVKITSETILNSNLKHFIDSNKHHIIALHFRNQQHVHIFLSFCIIDSSFNRLQSLILNKISTHNLITCLFYLKSLPHRLSLNIYIDDCFDHLANIYRMVLDLSRLKYFNLKICKSNQLDLNIPISNDNKLSSIEFLVLNHYCTFNEVLQLVLYTPKLTDLICINLIEQDDAIKFDDTLKLDRLINLKIQSNDIVFNNLEMFLLKLCSKLKTLNIKTEILDKDYLDVC